MSVLNTGLATPSRGYDIDQSLRFNDPDIDEDVYLARSWTSSNTVATHSVWFKHSQIGTTPGQPGYGQRLITNSAGFYDTFKGDDTIMGYGATGGDEWRTVAQYRDPSAWYHYVKVVDSQYADEQDRVKVYINGVRQTITFSGTSGQGNVEGFASAGSQKIASGWNGYLAEYHYIEGTAYAPSSFGETGDYGEWKPIEVSGLTYGTNGFYLDFADSGNLGNDVSGNDNDWTVTNLVASDQMLDTPTNNFATLNPLKDFGAGPPSNATFSEVNLSVTGSATGSSSLPLSTFSIPTDTPVYFEVVFTNQDCSYGIASDTSDSGNGGIIGTDTDGLCWGAYVSASASWRGFHNGGTRTAHNFSGGGVYQMAVDLANNKIWFGKDGVWYNSGNPATGANATYTNVSTTRDLFVSLFGNAGVANFGQDSSFAGNKTAQGNQDSNGIGDFYYTPPSGFLALCTQNLPEPAVIPSEHFNTVLYSGTGSVQTISGVGFQADFTWIKSRSNADNHTAFDILRYHGILYPNTTAAEGDTGGGWLRSWASDGFDVDVNGPINTNNQTYVAWNWKANGAGSLNEVGDIDSTVSVNTDAGFSIVSYTGTDINATVGHGLSKAPELLIIKRRESAGSWAVGSDGMTSWEYSMELDTADAEASVSSRFNSTAPTSSVFSIGRSDYTNAPAGEDYIAYCFHSVDGYSKMGSYVGNSSTDGAFVYTGFSPAYVMIHAITASQGWWIFDNTRDTDGNPMGKYLGAERNNAEYTGDKVDFVSNGFKWRHGDNAWNSGYTYIYLAYAEQPFKYSNAK